MFSLFKSHPPIVAMTMALGVLLLGSQANARCTRMTIFENENGSGSTTNIRVIGSSCFNYWPRDSPWHTQAKALRMTANIGCMKIWSSSSCSGQGQCICQRSHRTLTSWNSTTVGNTGALSFKECESGTTPTTGGTVQLFRQKNFQGSSITLEIPENQCETLRYDEDWKDNVASLRVTQGCVQLFEEAGCRGRMEKVWRNEGQVEPSEFEPITDQNNGEINGIDSLWSNKVRAFRACVPDEQVFINQGVPEV